MVDEIGQVGSRIGLTENEYRNDRIGLVDRRARTMRLDRTDKNGLVGLAWLMIGQAGSD